MDKEMKELKTETIVQAMYDETKQCADFYKYNQQNPCKEFQ